MGTFDLSGRRRLEQAGEGEGCVAAANATGRASPYGDRVAVLAIDRFTTRDADERFVFLGNRDGGLLGFLSEKHRTLLSQIMMG
jgi:hypothetical protein